MASPKSPFTILLSFPIQPLIKHRMFSERKHVRFDFTSTSLSPPPTSAKEVNKRRSSPESSPSRRFGFSPPNFIFAINHVSRRKQRQNKKGVLKNVQTEYKAVLSTSRTFPMSENEMMEEFGEDFVPRSYVAAVEKVGFRYLLNFFNF